MVAPIIPGLTDMEMERILERSAAAGVKNAGYALLRLPLEIGDLFTEWLKANCPDRANRVLSLMRSTRGASSTMPSGASAWWARGPMPG